MDGYTIMITVIVIAMVICMTPSHTCHPVNCSIKDLVADCSNRNLTSIPDLPHNIIALNMSHNRLTFLKQGAMANFSQNLRHLDLSFNDINNFHETSFKGLFHLRTLNLTNLNNLTGSAIPKDIFSDLHDLETLNLQFHNITDYPDTAFTPLKNLETLVIFSIPEPVFGQGFSNLLCLKTLQMDSGYGLFSRYSRCSIIKLTNETFQHLKSSQLNKLIINNCQQLNHIETGVLEPLRFLSHLELTHNHIGVNRALKILWPLGHKTLTRLWLNSTFAIEIENTAEYVLTANDTKYLVNICVSELSLSNNLITFITSDAFQSDVFHVCLKVLDLSFNSIIGDVDILHGNLSLFSKLVSINLRNQRLTLEVAEPHFPHVSNFIVQLPPSLQYLDITGAMNIIGPGKLNVTFKNASNLETFLFGYNSIFNRFHIDGLQNVKNLDVSGHDFSLVPEGYFNTSFPNVESLIMQRCGLQPVVIKHNIFKYVPNLLHLDVYDNELRLPPSPSNTDKLIHLNFSHNAFDTIPISVDNYINLKYLDMTYNSIGKLDQETRILLDEAHGKTKLKVYFKGNVLSCGCENLDFILWFSKAQVVHEPLEIFFCILDDGTTKSVSEIIENYKGYVRRCQGWYILCLTVTFLTIFVVSIFTTYLVCKNPTKYRNIIFRLFGFGFQLLTPKQFPFTLYVGYSDEDIPFVFQEIKPALEGGNDHLSLFLKDIEVLPGTDIAEGILEGVNNSWKTLLVVSRKFLENPWSNFIINTAVYSLTDMIPERIIVLLVGDVQVKDLPESLLVAVDEDFILRFDDYEDEEDNGYFWKYLKELVRNKV